MSETNEFLKAQERATQILAVVKSFQSMFEWASKEEIMKHYRTTNFDFDATMDLLLNGPAAAAAVTVTVSSLSSVAVEK